MLYLLLSCVIYNFLLFTHQTDSGSRSAYQRIFVQLNWQKIWAVLNLTWNKHWLYHRWIIRVAIYDFPCETHYPSMLSQLIFLFEVFNSNQCRTKSCSIVCLPVWGVFKQRWRKWINCTGTHRKYVCIPINVNCVCLCAHLCYCEPTIVLSL